MPQICFGNKKKNTQDHRKIVGTKLYLKITYKGSSTLIKNEFWLLCRMARTLHSGNKRTHTLTPLYLIVSSQQLNHKFIVVKCSEIVHFLNL